MKKVRLKIRNVITLLILYWSSQIPITSCNHTSTFRNFSPTEEAQVIDTLKFLDVYERRTFVFRKKKLEEYTLGTATNFYFQCYVELSPDIFSNEYFKPVLYHEIGHCFGLDHSPNPNDVMYENARKENEYRLLDWEIYFEQLKSCF